MTKRLYRLPDEGKIAGVAAGLAQYLEMDVTIVRALFVGLLFVTGGTALLLYIVLAVVMPTPESSKQESRDLGAKVEGLFDEMRTSGRARNTGNYIGIGLVVFGAWLLAGQLFPGWFSLQWNLLWPCLVILLGVWIISKGKK